MAAAPWVVSDELWERIEPLLPRTERRFRYPGRKRLPDRRALQGILFVLYTGIAWRHLPPELGFGGGSTCHRRMDQWQKAGVWEKLHALLLAELRAAGEIEWSRAVADSSHVQAKKDLMKGASGRVSVAAGLSTEGGPDGMLYAALDVHKQVLQAAVLEPGSGELRDARFAATREALREWALPLQGRVTAVALEATSGWRWVWRELSALGFEVQLAEPAQTRALRGKKRKAKNDRLDARWLALLLAKEMLPRSWIPPEDIQRLRDLTRLRQALRHDRTSWAQRLHALLAHEGWPCSRSQLLSSKGRRWLAGLRLDVHVRGLVDAHLAVIDAVSGQMAELERELGLLARSDRRLVALQTIYGVGPIVASHLLAEIGDARRFRRADQVVRVAGLDPVVLDSAETKRRGRLSKQGSPHLRWALVQAAQHAAIKPANSPDGDHYLVLRERIGSQRAAVSTARRIAKRAYHILAALENTASVTTRDRLAQPNGDKRGHAPGRP